MSRFNNTLKNLIKSESLSKFNYSNSFKTPKVEKIVLNLGIKKVNFKSLLSVVTLLEIISCHKSFLTSSKSSNISLKIRKGYPVGCFIILRNNHMLNFLNTINLNIFSKLKNINNTRFLKNKNRNIYNFSFDNLLIFSDLEHKYELFQDLVKLDISIVTNCSTFNELFFLLVSFRLPLK